MIIYKGKFIAKPTKFPLKERLSYDSYDTLKGIFEKLRRKNTLYYNVLLDICSVVDKLSSWKSISEVDLLIPYKYSHPNNEPMGSRVWHLSRKPDSKYYKGNWFDLKVILYHNRERIKQCRLSKKAIKILKNL